MYFICTLTWWHDFILIDFGVCDRNSILYMLWFNFSPLLLGIVTRTQDLYITIESSPLLLEIMTRSQMPKLKALVLSSSHVVTISFDNEKQWHPSYYLQAIHPLIWLLKPLTPTSELTFLLQLLNLVKFKVFFWFRGLNLWVCVHNKIQVS